MYLLEIVGIEDMGSGVEREEVVMEGPLASMD